MLETDDGDSISYTYTWYDPNGTDVQVTPGTSALSDTFAGSSTTAGLWECVVEASDGTDVSVNTADIEVDADWPGTLELNNCNQTGNQGPSQSQCDSEYSGTPLDGVVSVNSGIQTIIIPANGSYRITIAGAGGGSNGGYGIEISGDFTLSSGDSISVVVGQAGSGSTSNSGGGGGSFVWDSFQTATPLIVAGGGGGEGALMNSGLQNATSSTSGQNGCDGTGWGPSYTGIGGTNGQGGNGGSGGNAGPPRTGGGGGWLSDGTGTGNAPGLSAFDFIGGYSGTVYAGFGGGGGPDSGASGGGGGYSGGGGGGWGSSSDYRGACGGGGGSYNAGTNQNNQPATNTGHGYVIIEKL